jgi:SH3-like domain-containing protein
MFLMSPTQSWAQSFCVKKNGTELHESPKANSPISWVVGKYMPLQGTGEKKGSYLEAQDLDGQNHWVKRADISTKIHCVVIQVKSSRVRQGPGKKYPNAEVASMSRYSPFKDLGGEEGWTQVEDDTGAKGWLDLDHVWKPAGMRLRMSFENSDE